MWNHKLSQIFSFLLSLWTDEMIMCLCVSVLLGNKASILSLNIQIILKRENENVYWLLVLFPDPPTYLDEKGVWWLELSFVLQDSVSHLRCMFTIYIYIIIWKLFFSASFGKRIYVYRWYIYIYIYIYICVCMLHGHMVHCTCLYVHHLYNMVCWWLSW